MKSKYVGILAGVVGVGAFLVWNEFFLIPGDAMTESSLGGLEVSSVPKSISDTSDVASPSGNEVSSRYDSPNYNFYFDAPKGFRFTEIDDDRGVVILAEGSTGESFQIFVTPFDETDPLTPERIKKDLPQKVVSNPRAATLDGTKAIAFLSREEGTGEVFEIWFVRDGRLYQITTEIKFADGLQAILQTWKFTS